MSIYTETENSRVILDCTLHPAADLKLDDVAAIITAMKIEVDKGAELEINQNTATFVSQSLTFNIH